MKFSVKKYLFFLAALTVILTTSVAYASLHDYPNIAVLPFGNKASVSRELDFRDANLVSEFVIEELLDTGRFNVIEREQMSAIMEEQYLNSTGLVDQSTAVEIGKIVGVRYLVAGSIAGLSLKESGLGVGSHGVNVGGGKHTVIANVTARIIDVETGRILLASHGTGESSSTKVDFSITYTKGTPYEAYSYNPITRTSTLRRGMEPTKATLAHVTVGTAKVSQVQVHNAIAKACTDLVFGKNFGIITKMDGKLTKKK